MPEKKMDMSRTDKLGRQVYCGCGGETFYQSDGSIVRCVGMDLCSKCKYFPWVFVRKVK